MELLNYKLTIVLNLFLIVFILTVPIDCKREIQIGGIFHDDDPASQMAFKYAVERNNRRGGIEFVPLIRTVSSTDSYKAERIACNLTRDGVAAIFGPESQETRGIVESICKTLKIPNFQTFSSLDPPKKISDFPMSLNFYPDHQLFEQAIADFVMDSDWETFSVLYEDNDGLLRIQKVLENLAMGQMSIMQLTPGENNMHIFAELAEAGEVNIILDCSKERILDYLRQAQEGGMLEPHQMYILTSLDAHVLDYGEFSNGSANITALRVAYNAILPRAFPDSGAEVLYDPSPDTVTLNTALMIDAVNHLAESLNTLLVSTKRVPETKSIPCQSPNGTVWNLGKSVYQYVAESVTKSMTGDIQFKNSQRSSVKLEIVELSNRALENGVIKIGEWNIESGISYIASTEDIPSLETMWKVFVISSRIGEPYLQFKMPQDGEVLEGNDRFEGYSMDVMNGIAEILNISYVFELAEDNQHGTFDKTTKTWNGIMGNVIAKKADAGIADITINHERLKAVDFTSPFMDTGIGLLYSNADYDYKNVKFSFLQPFSLDIWTHSVIAYIAVSVFLYILTRISSNNICQSDSGTKNNTHNEKSSFYNYVCIPVGNLVNRGGYIITRSTSSRIAIGMWWFFTIIMISTYTANLTALRIKERNYSPVRLQIDDLPKQNTIKYGVLMGGSTSVFFKNSEVPQYRRIWENMLDDLASIPKSYDEGIEQVKASRGKYGFLMETSTLEYVASRDCSLKQLGSTISPRSFGIAMPLNSHYSSLFNDAILKMKQDGTLAYIKKKWWHDQDGAGCNDNNGSPTKYSHQLDFPDMDGIFKVLLYGTTVALFVAFAEFMWHVKKVAKRDEITFNSAFHKEWNVSRRIWTNTRTVDSNSSSTLSRSRHHHDVAAMNELKTDVC